VRIIWFKNTLDFIILRNFHENNENVSAPNHSNLKMLIWQEYRLYSIQADIPTVIIIGTFNRGPIADKCIE
jgi:hypothetical protein